MNKAKTVKEVLTAVEWMLENIGWTQGASYRDEKGATIYGSIENCSHEVKSMCLAGAINLVEVDEDKPGLRNEAFGTIAYKNALYSLISFNDSPDTTKEMVLAAVRKAQDTQ